MPGSCDSSRCGYLQGLHKYLIPQCATLSLQIRNTDIYTTTDSEIPVLPSIVYMTTFGFNESQFTWLSITPTQLEAQNITQWANSGVVKVSSLGRSIQRTHPHLS